MHQIFKYWAEANITCFTYLVGRGSFLSPLPSFFENGNTPEYPVQSTRAVSVHPMPSVEPEQIKEVSMCLYISVVCCLPLLYPLYCRNLIILVIDTNLKQYCGFVKFSAKILLGLPLNYRFKWTVNHQGVLENQFLSTKIFDDIANKLSVGVVLIPNELKTMYICGG